MGGQGDGEQDSLTMKGWILDMTNVSLTHTTHTHTTRSQSIHTDSQSTQRRRLSLTHPRNFLFDN